MQSVQFDFTLNSDHCLFLFDPFPFSPSIQQEEEPFWWNCSSEKLIKHISSYIFSRCNVHLPITWNNSDNESKISGRMRSITWILSERINHSNGLLPSFISHIRPSLLGCCKNPLRRILPSAHCFREG